MFLEFIFISYVILGRRDRAKSLRNTTPLHRVVFSLTECRRANVRGITAY